MVDAAGTKEPVRVTYSRRLRRPAGAVARRQDARVDVEPRRRLGRAAVPRAVEPREGARGAEERAAAESRQEIMKTTCASRRQHAALCARSSRLCALRGPRIAQARAHRRRARTSRRWRRRASRGGSPARTASGSPATTSSPSCRRSARSRCPGRRTSGCRSSSPPARATAARRSRRPCRRDGGVVVGQRQARRPRAVVLRQRRRRPAPVVFAGYGIVVPDSQGFALRQLRDARREGQDRRRAALLPRGRRAEDARRSSRATPTCATRRWRRGSTARRR